jgi:hypothetical protein
MRRKPAHIITNASGLEARIRRLETATVAQRTELLQERRRAFVEEMLATGRVASSEVPGLERAFATSPEATVAIVSGRPANAAIAAANAAVETEAESREYAAGFAARFGSSADKAI